MMNMKNSKPIPQQEQSNLALVSASSHSVTYIAPIPTASELKGYEQACKGAADRIISMAEKQAEHRQNIEKIVVEAASKRSILGVVFAFLIALFAFILSGMCFYWGHMVSANIIFGSALVTIVTAFIYGTSSNRQEREDKFEKAHQIKKSQD